MCSPHKIQQRRLVCRIDFDQEPVYSAGQEKTFWRPLEVRTSQSSHSKGEEVLVMDLSDVRTLGQGVAIDEHGHKLSGAAKLVYIVYGVDPVLVRKGRAFVEKRLKKTA